MTKEKYTEVELSNNELEMQPHLEEEQEVKSTKEVQHTFTVNGLAGFLTKFNFAILECEALNPNVERFSKVASQTPGLFPQI